MGNMRTQSKEFNALEKLFRANHILNLTPIVDDDYNEVRHSFEQALADFIEATKQNGRFAIGNAYGVFTPIGLKVEEARQNAPGANAKPRPTSDDAEAAQRLESKRTVIREIVADWPKEGMPLDAFTFEGLLEENALVFDEIDKVVSKLLEGYKTDINKLVMSTVIMSECLSDMSKALNDNAIELLESPFERLIKSVFGDNIKIVRI
jgi:hypothetical protein